jgi:hypothetical protein
MAFAPSLRLVGRAIELDHRGVDFDLILDVESKQLLADIGVDVIDRLGDALAHEGVAAIAQFHRLMGAGRRTGGTAARPTMPFSSSTSTSTVGLPRLSKIWRA